MRITQILAGTDEAQDLIRCTTDGLYIDHPITGQVRGGLLHIRALAHRIEGGKVTEALGPVVILDEPLAAMAKIERIANDSTTAESVGWCSREGQRDLPVGLIAPTLMVRDLTVVPWTVG